MEHKAFLFTWYRTFVHTREKDVLFQNAVRTSLASTPRKEPFHVMLVETNHTQEQKKRKVWDWNHLSLSVTMPAKPTSSVSKSEAESTPDRDHASRTFEHEDQNATKITSTLADSCIQSPWPVMSISVRTLCLCLVLMTICLSMIHFSFSPSFATMSSSKPIGVRRVNRRTRKSCSAPWRPLLWSSGVLPAQHRLGVWWGENATRKTHKGARQCRYWSKFHERK